MSLLPQIWVSFEASGFTSDGEHRPNGSPLAGAIGTTVQLAMMRPRKIAFVPKPASRSPASP